MAKAKKKAKVKAQIKATNKSQKKVLSKKVAAKSKVSAKKVSAKAKLKPKPKSKAKTTGHSGKIKIKPKLAIKNLSQFVTPLDDRVFVQLSSAERMTAGGLIIPDTVKEASGNLKGVVVAIGRGHLDSKGKIHPMDVQIGETVLFADISGNKIKLLDSEYVILRESDLLGIVK